MPPFSRVGVRVVGPVWMLRIAGALGWVPCILLGLARWIGLLFELLLPGRFCAWTLAARARPSANAARCRTRVIMTKPLWDEEYVLSIPRYALGSAWVTKLFLIRCNTICPRIHPRKLPAPRPAVNGRQPAPAVAGFEERPVGGLCQSAEVQQDDVRQVGCDATEVSRTTLGFRSVRRSAQKFRRSPTFPGSSACDCAS